MSDDLTFVLCIENNAIRTQALLLCESIRQFGGRHRHAPIFAIAPREGLGVDDACRRQLAGMSVDYVEESLNHLCPQYGSANRVFAAAWAEARARSEWIAVLDSDTIFLADPDLPSEADVAVRPVDAKGSATAGPGDEFESYWARLAALQHVSLDALPFIRTTICGHRIRASYNGGLIVVRRKTGILGAWASLFARSVVEGLKPWKRSALNVHASTGFVGLEASEYWGSNQAAAALAIWSTTERVVHYSDAYNIPLHILTNKPQLEAWPMGSPPVHVHYHWLFTEPHFKPALDTLRQLGAGPHPLEWLTERLPLG